MARAETNRLLNIPLPFHISPQLGLQSRIIPPFANMNERERENKILLLRGLLDPLVTSKLFKREMRGVGDVAGEGRMGLTDSNECMTQEQLWIGKSVMVHNPNYPCSVQGV